MELPVLKLPQIPLPFDIPALLHPPVVHFVIAIPILVLLVEIINLVAKKRAIGVITFFILIVGMVATAAAYLTGTVDGKEAFDALSQTGQSELKEHKLLGTYLVLGSAVVVIFKMISALLQRGLAKAMYLLVLIVFTLGILKQGKDGGELVYQYGANVERVADLDSELFDVKEELDEMKAEAKEAAKVVEEKSSQVAEAVKTETEEAVEAAKERIDTAQTSVEKAVSEAEKKTTEVVEKGVEEAESTVKNVTEAVTPSVSEEVSAHAEETAKATEEVAAQTVPEAAVEKSDSTVSETETH